MDAQNFNNKENQYDSFDSLKHNKSSLFKYLTSEIEQIDQPVMLPFKMAYENFSSHFSRPPTCLDFQIDIMFALESRRNVDFGMTELNQRVSRLWDACGYNNEITDIFPKSELEIHMSDFEDLGFVDLNVYNWHRGILETLEKHGVIMNDFYFTKQNINNKNLIEQIVLVSETYHLLNGLKLLNQGFCPITAESIDNTSSYNMYGRHIYLSKKGLEVCKKLNSEDWKGDGMTYNEFEKERLKVTIDAKKKASALLFVFILISLIISWNIVSPSGFFSFLGFLLVGVIFFFIIGWLFNFLWDLFN